MVKFMRHPMLWCTVALLLACVAWPQGKNYESTGMTICEVLKDTSTYSGKFVRITGQVSLGPEVSALSSHCANGDESISLEYPTAEWRIPSPFELQKDDMYSTFEMIVERYSIGLGSPPPMQGMPSPKPIRQVIASFVGRFDGPDKLVMRDASGDTLTRKGFGHQNQFQARLVIRSVESVTVTR
jgi:hypothetical protein